MQTLKEQFANRCKHFNGIMNKLCEAGINYDTFRGGQRPFKFPCLNQGGECKEQEFMTSEEVEQEIKAITESSLKTITAHGKISKHFKETKEYSGKVSCDCGGELAYRVTKSNGHIWAKCSKCDISFME